MEMPIAQIRFDSQALYTTSKNKSYKKMSMTLRQKITIRTIAKYSYLIFCTIGLGGVLLWLDTYNSIFWILLVFEIILVIFSGIAMLDLFVWKFSTRQYDAYLASKTPEQRQHIEEQTQKCRLRDGLFFLENEIIYIKNITLKVYPYQKIKTIVAEESLSLLHLYGDSSEELATIELAPYKYPREIIIMFLKMNPTIKIINK